MSYDLRYVSLLRNIGKIENNRSISQENTTVVLYKNSVPTMRVKKGRLQKRNTPVKIATVTLALLFLLFCIKSGQGRDSCRAQTRKLKKVMTLGTPSSSVVRVFTAVTQLL